MYLEYMMKRKDQELEVNAKLHGLEVKKENTPKVEEGPELDSKSKKAIEEIKKWMLDGREREHN